jgi:hypothetical protein
MDIIISKRRCTQNFLVHSDSETQAGTYYREDMDFSNSYNSVLGLFILMLSMLQIEPVEETSSCPWYPLGLSPLFFEHFAF